MKVGPRLAIPAGVSPQPARRPAPPQAARARSRRATPISPFPEEAAIQERQVTVTIGRLEVRVASESAAPAAPRLARPPAMSLQDYLRNRGGES